MTLMKLMELIIKSGLVLEYHHHHKHRVKIILQIFFHPHTTTTLLDNSIRFYFS